MTATDQTSSARSGNWLANQPYLLLSITALCWAGNAIVGRMAAGHIAPVTLSFLRWSFAFLIILPFAWKHLVARLGRDPRPARHHDRALDHRHRRVQYPAILGARAHPGAEYAAAAVGGPLVVAVWSLALLGVRLTLAQAAGVLLSMAGVLVILMHGDLTKLSNIEFNRGDLIFIVALVIFGLYSVLSLKRPDIHALSFVAFTFGAGAACLIPLFIWELFARPLMQIDTANLLTLFYVALFPSTIAYLCFNRGVQLIGANRAAPFFHVVPVFGTVMSIVFLGEHPQAFQFIGFALVLTGVFVASRKASA